MHQYAVNQQAQVAFPEIHNPFSAGGSDVGIANIPFLRHVPVEDLCPGGHLERPQRNAALDSA
jgi:hypothetical protein